jgi:hypothetical protein
MGVAYDTILAFSTQAGAAAFPTALAAAQGDNLTIRGTVGESKAYLEAFIAASNAGGQKFRVSSPLLHDNVTGLTFAGAENPAPFLLPAQTYVELNEQDTLSVSGSCAAATTITAGLVVRYPNIRGVQADLYHWRDIKDDIKFLKSIEVDLNAIAVGAWTDTVVTVTENQLHADASYAVLGYQTSQAIDIVGVKGIATGNLRYCGPGVATTLDISSYFIYQSEEGGDASIPVFQANDRNSFYVSAANHAAIGGAAASVYLLVAELKHKK